MADSKNIYQLISLISEEAGALGKEDAGGVPFKFRGIDSTINHLAPLLRKYNVVVYPSVAERVTTTRELLGANGTPSGKAITQTDALVDFTFVAPDGTSLTVRTNGLAQDHADRSAAQAQSVAFRVALLQTFFLPTDSKEPEVSGEETQAYIDKQVSEAKPVVAKETVESVRGQITALISGSGGKITGERVNELLAEITNGKPSNKWTVTDLKKALVKLSEAGA